jgi:hypothetical protein
MTILSIEPIDIAIEGRYAIIQLARLVKAARVAWPIPVKESVCKASAVCVNVNSLRFAPSDGKILKLVKLVQLRNHRSNVFSTTHVPKSLLTTVDRFVHY